MGQSIATVMIDKVRYEFFRDINGIGDWYVNNLVAPLVIQSDLTVRAIELGLGTKELFARSVKKIEEEKPKARRGRKSSKKKVKGFNPFAV